MIETEGAAFLISHHRKHGQVNDSLLNMCALLGSFLIIKYFTMMRVLLMPAGQISPSEASIKFVFVQHRSSSGRKGQAAVPLRAGGRIHVCDLGREGWADGVHISLHGPRMAEDYAWLQRGAWQRSNWAEKTILIYELVRLLCECDANYQVLHPMLMQLYITLCPPIYRLQQLFVY